MIVLSVAMHSPSINAKSDSVEGCRCITVEITTAHNDVIRLQFDSIDDARTLHHLLGIALGAENIPVFEPKFGKINGRGVVVR